MGQRVLRVWLVVTLHVPPRSAQVEGYLKAEVASDTLVALSRNHFSVVMYEMQHHLRPLDLTDEFVIVTLAKLANGNGRARPQPLPAGPSRLSPLSLSGLSFHLRRLSPRQDPLSASLPRGLVSVPVISSPPNLSPSGAPFVCLLISFSRLISCLSHSLSVQPINEQSSAQAWWGVLGHSPE